MKPGSISTRILISFLIILLAAFSMPQPAEAQGTTQVYLNPASSTVTTCADLTIAVSVADVQDLYGYALRLTFTPGSLQVLNVVNGGFLSDGLMAPTNGWNNTTGEILFDMSMMGEPEGRDGSGDLIRITLRATTPGATVAFTIDPVYSQLVNWPAVMPIPFTITDGTVTTAGCAPTDISLSSSTVAENQPAGVLVGSFSSVDADTGETFTYSLQDDVSFPDNHYFQISGNQLLTLLPADYETDPSLLIRVRTTDSTGLYYEETLTITVTDINDAPVLDPIPNPSGGEETLITFTATASDQDGDALTFSLTDGTAGDVPAGASITAGGVFTWTPTEAQGPGTYTFDVCVGDGTETDCQTITVTVNEVNVAPVLNPVGDQTVHEGDTLTFTATATDADVPANTLTFSLAGTLPAGASITAGGVFTWTPTAEQAPGWYTFDVCVSDGALNDCETIDVTVTSDEPPVVYVDDGWAGTLPGVDPDGTGPATAFGYDAFALIQDGVNGVAPDGTVYVAAGTYFESDILIDQPMDLIGAGAGASIIGPAVADGHDCSPLGSNAHFGIIIGADGVTIQGFTIDGNQDGSLPGDYNYRMGITSRYWVATYDTSTVLDTVVQNIWYRGVVIRAYTGETSSDHRLDNVDVANIVNTCTDEQSFAILYFNAAGEIANSTATNAYQGIATGNYTGIPLVANIHHNVVTDITSQAYTLTHNDAGTVFANNTATFTNPANAGIGLLVYQANGFTVTNNTFTGAHTGVYVGRQVGDPSLFVIGAGNTLTGPGITVAGSVGVLADGTGWADENSNFTLEKSLITGYETGVRLDRLDTTGTTTAVVRSNNLLDNGTGIYLGTRSTLTAHHNRIFNNTVGYNNASGGAAVAENNWWGCNVGPNDTYGDCDTTVNVDYTPWLVLQGTAPTSETEFGAPPVTFTARLMRNSAGEDASSPTLGYVPDGIVVSFQTMDGIFTPPTSPLVNGVTTSQYTANNARASLLCAVLDNEWYGGGGCWTILINDAPIPGTNTFTTGEDTPLNGTLAATDDEGYALTYVVATPPAHGTVTINLDGTFTYTPATDWFGTDTFTFTVSDDIGGVTGTATITVTPVNDAPVAVDDTATTAEDTPVDILVSTLLANDTDIDGDTLSLTAVSNPSNGTVALAVGVVTFTPADNFHGEAGFDYTVSDGTLTDTGHVTITVTPVNDAPVADDQSLSTPEETALPVTLT
ncbi:MAG TPA: Ig-like domain-containing protein, partial [Anaerolineaceae bacterium]|nr:Ig-like domain-containing protein [Anaerolineaceae bacterium]